MPLNVDFGRASNSFRYPRTAGNGFFRIPLHNGLLPNSQAINSGAAGITELEELRRGLHAANPGWRASQNDIARPQRHEAADIADEVGASHDHLYRGTVLFAHSVDLKPERRVLRIGDLVRSHEPRTQGREAVAPFPLDSLPLLFFLKLPFGIIVGDHVTGDAKRSRFGIDGRTSFADDDDKFDLPVQAG